MNDMCKPNASAKTRKRNVKGRSPSKHAVSLDASRQAVRPSVNPLYPLTKQASNQNVDENGTTSHQELVVGHPAPARLSLLHNSVHDSLHLAATGCHGANEWRSTRRSRGVEALTSGYIDLVLLHPFPVGSILLRPFLAELLATVAHLDVSLLRGLAALVGPASGRVPPARSGGQKSALLGGGCDGAGRDIV